MQTFLPYISFRESAKCLDNKRLGKQRVEAMQILQALEPGSTSRWRNHPAVKMWRSYEGLLEQYKAFMIIEWKARGFNNTMTFEVPFENHAIPYWLDYNFTQAHRSNLLRKDPVWYGQFNWNVPDNLPYIWPV
jgi:hypothetical protein